MAHGAITGPHAVFAFTRGPVMAPWAITEARYGSVGPPEFLEKLQDSQFASAAPVNNFLRSANERGDLFKGSGPDLTRF